MSKPKDNKWVRLQAQNAKLQKENAELRAVVQSRAEVDSVLERESIVRRADLGSSQALILGELLEPPTEMPIDAREPLVAEPAEVEPDGDRGWSLES